MLKVEGITKNYPGYAMSCSFEVKPGYITGFVGRNGAGKSTAFKAVLGLISIEEGKITLFGKSHTEITASDKERIGAVLSDSGFSSYLGIKDICHILKGSYRHFEEKKFLDGCRRFRLPADKKLKDFSTGMKAKLKLLAALSHKADFLLLDEPTAGLDVEAREEMLGCLRDYMDDGRAILISSHISTDLEKLCDDIYLIHNGRIMLHEDTDVLLSDYALLKVDEEQYRRLDKEYILYSKCENGVYRCFTSQKKFYMENYPQIVIESGKIDDLVLTVE